MSQLYVSNRNVVVANGQGPTALFRAGVPRPLRDSLVEAAIGQGVRPADGQPAKLPERESRAPEIAEIAEAIRRVMDRGVKSDFTATGVIRMGVLSKEIGHEVSTSDRDAAMELVSAVQDE